MVTRVAYSRQLNPGKYRRRYRRQYWHLAERARRLGRVRTGTSLLGSRVGDRLYCPHPGRVMWDADPDIGLHTPHQRVKQIIQERADRQRSRRPDQDSNTACRSGGRILQNHD